ncbi:MAG: hydroxymethylglutaryl-CoA lyase [Bacillota bacterium]|nr:hydroxymethylglutaryl-CoA lyase [Bacillota bacterium]
MNMKEVNIIEVAPRDGFQIIEKFIETEKKLKIIDMLISSGIQKMQVTSFVNPKAVPQMKDAREVVKKSIEKYPDFEFTALIPNYKGGELAVDSGIKELSYVISASESHNMENVRRTVDESFDELKRIREDFKDIKIKLDIATTFGCPFEGEIDINKVLKMIYTGLDMGIDEIFLADTIGVANPKQIKEVISVVKKEFKEIDFGLHLHDTEGMGLANIYASSELGINKFESAVGGLGGCPFAPGAAGNVATEDLVNMFEKMGVRTNISLSKLLKTTDYIKKNVKSNLTGHLSNVRRKV